MEDATTWAAAAAATLDNASLGMSSNATPAPLSTYEIGVLARQTFLYDIFLKINWYYGGVIVAVGLVGNTLSFLIMMQVGLQRIQGDDGGLFVRCFNFNLKIFQTKNVESKCVECNLFALWMNIGGRQVS